MWDFQIANPRKFLRHLDSQLLSLTYNVATLRLFVQQIQDIHFDLSFQDRLLFARHNQIQENRLCR